jgi:integrase
MGLTDRLQRIKEVSDTFERTVKKLGFNEGITDRRHLLTFHSLRHTFASWLALNGEQLKTIQELMRHKTIQMTMKYAHLIPDKKRQAVNNIMK